MPEAPLIAEIHAATCAYFEIDAVAMNGARRAARFARPRQIAMYLAHQLTAQSTPAIGRRFGGRDHSTVLHAVARIRSLIETDAEVAAAIQAIEQSARSRMIGRCGGFGDGVSGD